MQTSAVGSTVTTSTGYLVNGHLLKQRYRILGQVGKGGFGAVYKAADILFGNRLVAVKEMSQSNLSPQDVVATTISFQHEAHLLAELSHPNLPRIYDQFADDGRWYLVMDFIEGETLEEHWQKVGIGQPFRGTQPLPLEEVLRIGIELCTVLDYLHTRQPSIIFRDLKPANIMLAPDGHLYLIDFGIARHFKPGQAKDTTALGSTGYAAPEQYGKAQTTPRSDIYSLGATLHQLLTGNDPSDTPFNFAQVQLPGEPLSGRFDVLIQQMVAVDASRRPHSVFTVKQELQRLTTLLAAKKKMNLLQPVVGAAQLGITLYTYIGHSDRVNAVAWSPDGVYLASGSGDKTVQVWDALSGDHVLVYAGHSDAVNTVAWSPDGKRIASASNDRTVQVWDAATGRNIFTYAGHVSRVNTVAWSPDGVYLASGSDDKTVQVWEAADGKHVSTYRGHSDWVRTIAWSSNGAHIASGGDDSTVQIWEATTRRKIFSKNIYHGHSHWVRAVAWSPDSERIASASDDKTVQLWNATSRVHIFNYEGHSNGVRTAAWSPDGRFIASGSGSSDSYGADNTVRIWNSFTGDTIYVYRGHFDTVLAVAWSSNGEHIASAGKDGTVQVWRAI